MSDYTELKRLAEAFPADLDLDSNTEPFFNGPSGESLGGGATGFYCVYGKPFRLEGEDYDYDGPTYVEACPADFAKFMVAAREGVLALIADLDDQDLQTRSAREVTLESQTAILQLLAERDQLKSENESLRLFVSAACPVSTEINPRGYNWCEPYLDDALKEYRAAMGKGEQS